MKPNLTVILTLAVALSALPLTTDGSWGAHGGGGHGGGGHFGGGHFGGRHVGSTHFGGSHLGGGHLGSGHFGGSHFGGGRFGGRNQFAGGRNFAGRSGFSRNAFGTRGGWNQFAANGEAAGWGGDLGGWGGGWGGWGGWVGPVFWPFLLGDVFSYALWPDAYYYPFWSYGTALDYDYEPYVYYGYGGLSNIYGYAGSSRYVARANQVSPYVMRSCGEFAPGVTSFPIAQIRQAIRPTEDQITLLNDLADATSKASAIVSASCPSEPPLTPLARLDAVGKRLEAMIQAIKIVRPALANLYDSLSDEQKQRMDAIGVKEARSERAAAVTGSANTTTLASLCGDQAASFTRLPVQRIEEIVKPRGQQRNALEALRQVSENAADQLRASCPARTPDSPVSRLDVMSSRLDAMIQTVKTVRPALVTFYASLSDEQKAQFNNRIGSR